MTQVLAHARAIRDSGVTWGREPREAADGDGVELQMPMRTGWCGRGSSGSQMARGDGETVVEEPA
jgi:hypothetical protein